MIEDGSNLWPPGMGSCASRERSPRDLKRSYQNLVQGPIDAVRTFEMDSPYVAGIPAINSSLRGDLDDRGSRNEVFNTGNEVGQYMTWFNMV